MPRKWKIVYNNLTGHSISHDSMRIYLRAFKTEKVMEVWAKNICDPAFVLVKELPICDVSGSVGPKSSLAMDLMIGKVKIITESRFKAIERFGDAQKCSLDFKIIDIYNVKVFKTENTLYFQSGGSLSSKTAFLYDNNNLLEEN